jgi:hypothetical protein
MRKGLILALTLTMISMPGLTTNGRRPESLLDKNAGRVLNVEEVMRIRDDQGDFYFKSPHDIQIGPDGNIFLIDEEQFLKFSAEGRFIKNLYRKGQGPGEFDGIGGYIIADDAIAAFQHQPNKLVVLTLDGELIRELRPEVTVAKLFALHGERYVTGRYSIPKFGKVGEEPTFIQVDWSLCYISEDGGVEEPDAKFSAQWYAKRIGRAMIADHIADFTAVPYRDEALILSHTEGYGMKLFDLTKNRVVREFGRDYKRVKSQQEKTGQIEIRPGVFRLAPPVEYVNDIQQVFVRDEAIWVLTSTIEPQKGALIDVFNIQGEYIDHFYLPVQPEVTSEGLEGLPLTFHGDFFFIAEYDEDGIPSIVKYRITSPE